MTSQPMHRNSQPEKLESLEGNYDYSAILSTRRQLSTAELDVLLIQAALWRAWSSAKRCFVPHLLFGTLRRDRRGCNPA
jgi:hypothetical protein